MCKLILSFLPLFAIFAFIALNAPLVKAQDKDDEPVEEVVTSEEVAAPVVRAAPSRVDEDEDDGKVTGATVRGRVVYQDSERPVRYALVGLIKSTENGYVSEYSTKYVKTDENGNFVIKNVKEGSYYPYIKSEGILNFSDYKTEGNSNVNTENKESLFEKITVSGLSEFQVYVRAKRGGAINGVIRYSDGEAAVGVKVEVLKKVGDKFSAIPVSLSNAETVKTDDRGVYRFFSLPEGQYIVRAIEPVSHSNKAQDVYAYRGEDSSLFKTYYPEGSTSKTAREIAVLFGQEQNDIDITLPERQLFSISGKVIQKQSRQPLKNFSVNFHKISEADEGLENTMFAIASGGSNANSTNSLGDWSLVSLPKGKYRITIAQAYVYRNPQEKTEKEPEYPSLSKEIEITDKDLTDVDFEVPLGGVISGTVTVEGAKNLPQYMSLFAVNLATKQTSASGYDYADARNENAKPKNQKDFRIAKLSEGKHQLTYFGQDYYIKSITHNGKEIKDTAIDVKDGGEIQGVHVVLTNEFGTVKGKVANFNPKERTSVAVVKSNIDVESGFYGNSFGGFVKANGEFEIKAAPGEYSVIVMTQKTAPKKQEEAVEWMKKALQNAPKITVKVNEITGVNLSLPN